MELSSDVAMRDFPGHAVSAMGTDHMPFEDRDGNDIYSLRRDPLRDWVDLEHDSVSSPRLVEGDENPVDIQEIIDRQNDLGDDGGEDDGPAPLGEEGQQVVPMQLRRPRVIYLRSIKRQPTPNLSDVDRCEHCRVARSHVCLGLCAKDSHHQRGFWRA
ncbi:MAG TPA: hypothetical protein VF803_03530 [Candidatus Paceibacterota bacterium]